MKHSDCQNLLKIWYNEDSCTFGIDAAKKHCQDKIQELNKQKKSLEGQLDDVSKKPDSASKWEEIALIAKWLLDNQKAIEEYERMISIDKHDLFDYLFDRSTHLMHLTEETFNILTAPIEEKYTERNEVFQDDPEALSTLGKEKEVEMERITSENIRLEALQIASDIINNLWRSALFNNVYGGYMADLSWLVCQAMIPHTKSIYSVIKDKWTHDKISFDKLQQLKSIHHKKDLSYLLNYYGIALTAHMKVNTPIEALSIFTNSENQLKELWYDPEEIVKKLSLPNFDLSTLNQTSNEHPEDNSEDMDKYIKGNEKNMAVSLKKLSGLKLLSDTFDKLPLAISDTINAQIAQLFPILSKLHNKIERDGVLDETSIYVSYNNILGQYTEELVEIYQKIDEIVHHLIKNPSIEDKILTIQIIGNIMKRITDESFGNSISLFFSFRTEECLVDVWDKQKENISNILNFTGVFCNLLENIITTRNDYPLLFNESFKDKYGEDHLLENKLETFNSLKEKLSYIDATLKAKSTIEEVNQEIESDSWFINKLQEEDLSPVIFLDTITQNLHKLPYNDTIILSLANPKTEYTVELHRIDNPNYLWILRVNSFDSAIEWEKLNQCMVDFRNSHGTTSNITESKQSSTKGNEYINGDIIAIQDINDSFWWLFMLHINWDISINGINEDGLRYIVWDAEYDRFKYILLQDIAECCGVIDKRGVDGSQQNMYWGIHDHEDIHRKDPRVLYDDTNEWEHKGIKNIFYRREHVRLLHENMITWYTWRHNARRTWIPLYACVYLKSADPAIDLPTHTIRIDNLSDDFNERRKQIKALRDIHNTTETVIHFQTYVDEFIKDWHSHQGQTITVLENHDS